MQEQVSVRVATTTPVMDLYSNSRVQEMEVLSYNMLYRGASNVHHQHLSERHPPLYGMPRAVFRGSRCYTRSCEGILHSHCYAAYKRVRQICPVCDSPQNRDSEGKLVKPRSLRVKTNMRG